MQLLTQLMLANRERASKMCAWETTVSGYKYILVNRYTHHSSMTTVSNKISLQSKNLRISYAKTTVFSCQILLHHYIRIALTIILQNYPHSKSMIYPSNIHFLMDCSPNEPMSQCCHTSTETVRFIWDGEPRTGSPGRGAQDGHLDFHTAPELWEFQCCFMSTGQPPWLDR